MEPPMLNLPPKCNKYLISINTKYQVRDLFSLSSHNKTFYITLNTDGISFTILKNDMFNNSKNMFAVIGLIFNFAFCAGLLITYKILTSHVL